MVAVIIVIKNQNFLQFVYVFKKTDNYFVFYGEPNMNRYILRDIMIYHCLCKNKEKRYSGKYRLRKACFLGRHWRVTRFMLIYNLNYDLYPYVACYRRYRDLVKLMIQKKGE